MEEELYKIVGKKVSKLYLIIWPPYGEDNISQTDISVGYVFEDNLNELFVVTTDKNDLTIPFICSQKIPDKHFNWEEFKPRIQSWMNCVEGLEMDTEYYEVSKVNVFKNIVGKKIIDVELVETSDETPFGIKIVFKDDYILSTPINDGNTIETSLFNQNNNIKNFFILGDIKYRSIKNK